MVCLAGLWGGLSMMVVIICLMGVLIKSRSAVVYGPGRCIIRIAHKSLLGSSGFLLIQPAIELSVIVT